MTNSIDITKYDEKTQEAIAWVRHWWGHSAGGRGTAARRKALKKSYGKILAQAGLGVYFVRKGLHASLYDVVVIE